MFELGLGLIILFVIEIWIDMGRDKENHKKVPPKQDQKKAP